jgi:hypothetical protein
MWVNYIVNRAQKAKVVNLAISGIFYDSLNYKYDEYYYREMFKNVVKITNEEVDSPVSECVQEFPNNK